MLTPVIGMRPRQAQLFVGFNRLTVYEDASDSLDERDEVGEVPSGISWHW